MKLAVHCRRWKSHWEWISLIAEYQYDAKSSRLTFCKMSLKTSSSKNTDMYVLGVLLGVVDF